MSDASHEPPYDEIPELTNDVRNWAVLCHLAAFAFLAIPPAGHILGPLVVWLFKRNEHPYIDEQGKEAVNFQISMSIYAIFLLCIIIGIPFLFALPFINAVLVVMAAIKASQGESFHYPLCLRLIR